MSTEMVACIAVESISILEKMHSRGYELRSTLDMLVLCDANGRESRGGFFSCKFW